MKSGRAVLDFGAFPGSSHASVAVAVGDIPASAVVSAWVDRRETTDHSADEHTVERFTVTAGDIVAGTGFTIHGVLSDQAPPVSGNAPLAYGQFAVAWAWEER